MLQKKAVVSWLVERQRRLTNGQHLVVAGLVLQIIIFGFFTVVAFVFNYRLRRAFKKSAIVGSPIYQKHLNALYISSGFIMVRSIFRVVEYVQGNDGYILRLRGFYTSSMLF